MEHFEILHTDTRTVACDGGKGSLGHPRVFLNMGDATEVTCPYCSRHYVLQGDGKKAASH